MKINQASSTAYTVLQGLLLTAANPDYSELVDDDTVRIGTQILNHSDEGKRRLKQIDNPFYRSQLRLLERLLLPGISLHYALRKRFIEQHTLEAIAAGVQQVISLGAGFDTLAWRLHRRYPEVRFIEIDHPATSREKSAALMQGHSSNLILLAIDLAENDLMELLSDNKNFNPQLKTLFICEGVLMYLGINAVRRLFDTLRRCCSEAQFLFTAIAPSESDENNSTWLLKLYLKLKNEPLNWSIEPGAMASFLQQQGFTMNELAGEVEMYRRYLEKPLPKIIHKGEFAVACRALPITA